MCWETNFDDLVIKHEGEKRTIFSFLSLVIYLYMCVHILELVIQVKTNDKCKIDLRST